MKRTLLLAAVSAALVLPAEPAWACRCVALAPAEWGREAEMVFAGTVISSRGEERGPKVTTFALDTIYKGRVEREVAVQHHVHSAACGLSFAEGERYTVFVYDTRGRLETNSCWPTTAGDIDARTFGLDATPVAQASDRRDVDVGEVWPFWVALSGLVFAIGALSMWDTRRRRRGPRGRETPAN